MLKRHLCANLGRDPSGSGSDAAPTSRELRRTDTGGLPGRGAGHARTPSRKWAWRPPAPGSCPWRSSFGTLPRSDLEEREAWAIRNGQELPAAAGLGAEGERALFGPAGEFIGVGRVAGGRLAAARLMATGIAG